MVWTKEGIEALLAKNNEAVYRALLRLDADPIKPLPPLGRTLAKWVRQWNETEPQKRRFSYPLGLNNLREARRIVTELSWRLAAIANENERRRHDEALAEMAAERYYEDRYEMAYRQDHPYDY